MKTLLNNISRLFSKNLEMILNVLSSSIKKYLNILQKKVFEGLEASIGRLQKY